MKLALVILFILGTAFMVSEACHVRCWLRFTYIRVCSRTTNRCRFFRIISRVCLRVNCAGKRSLAPAVEVGFPCNFAEYDTNGNGEIDKKEFQTALKITVTSENISVLDSFKEWDKNGDGLISCDEFRTSKHEFECQPHGCESNQNEADEELWDTE